MWPITAMTGGRCVRAIMAPFHHKNGSFAIFRYYRRMFFKSRTYLDRAAGATANPSSPHAEGREAKRILEEARTAIARLAEAQADDVIFTGGATEANALAILGVAHASAVRAGSPPHVLYLPSAHASIVE